MKVLDLQCPHQHVFEGWFASEDDFQSQLSRGLASSPLWGHARIEKKLSAPRLNLGAPRPPGETSSSADAGRPQPKTQAPGDVALFPPEAAQTLQASWLRMVRHVMANTQDVGEKFAETARQMHYAETEERSIRGQASPEEALALLEEGITVMPLPVPDALKEPLQ